MRRASIAFLFLALIFIAGCAQYDRADCGNTQMYKLRLEQARCYYNLALLQEDELICDNIYTGTKGALYDVTSGKIKVECFKEVAIKKAEKYREEGVGIPNNIANICEKINANAEGDVSGNPASRDMCFYEVAVLTGHPSICGRISEATVQPSSEGDTKLSLRELCEEEASH